MEVLDPNRIFFNKTDANFYKVSSESAYFFEIFSLSKQRSNEIIPKTIVFNQGSPQTWYFNSEKDKSNTILRKNQDKVTDMHILKYFCNIRMSDETIDSIFHVKDTVSKYPNQKNPIAFVKFKDGSFQCMNMMQLACAIETKTNKQICMIQSVIPKKERSNEVYYCELRHEIEEMPSIYRVFKKVILVKEKLDQVNTNNSSTQSTSEQGDVKQQKPAVLTYHREFFKSFDTKLNEKLQLATRRISNYIENVLKIKVKKYVAKFVINNLNQVIYTGGKELFVDILYNGKYDEESLRQDLAQGVSTDQLKNLVKQHKIEGNKKAKKPLLPLLENVKPISSVLQKKLEIDQCRGDFCVYKTFENNQGPLTIRKEILDDYKQQFGAGLQIQNGYALKLDYEIPNQLILRSRNCMIDVIGLLERNSLFPNGKQEETMSGEEIEKFVKKKRKEVDNFMNLYKRVKICQQCHLVYSLISKYFDELVDIEIQQIQGTVFMEKKEMFVNPKQKKRSIFNAGNHEKRSGASIPHSTHRLSYITSRANTMLQNSEFNDVNDIIRQNLDEAQKQIIRDNDVKNLNEKQRSLSIQLYLKKKEDVNNRMTLGFLNYDHVREKYKPISKQFKQSEFSNQNNQNEVIQKSLNIFDHFKVINTDRILKNEQQGDQNTDIKYDKNLYNQRNNIQELYNKKDHKQNFLKNISSFYHPQTSNFNHIRQIFKFQKNTPMVVLNNDQCVEQTIRLTLKQVCDLSEYIYPQTDFSGLQFLIYDAYTAIPYKIIESKTIDPDIKCKVTIFIHDIFDSITEYIDVFEKLLENQSNHKIILFNIPGQAFTLFSTDKIYDAFVITEIFEQIIFTLYQQKSIDINRDSFRIVGLGFTSYYIQTILINMNKSIKKFEKIGLINSIAYVDQQIESLFKKSYEIFEGSPKFIPELAYNYYSILIRSVEMEDEKISQKLAINPITISGRLALIQGILNSNYFKNGFEQIPVDMEIFHQIQNKIVSINHVDKLVCFKLNEPIQSENFRENLSQLQEVNPKRNIHYIKNGISIFEDDIEEFISIMKGLLTL